MNGLTIGRATSRDFLAIAALDRVAWQNTRQGDFIPDGEHVWRVWCEHALTFVCRDSTGVVLGVVVAFPCTNQSFCLHKAMVARSHQGQGIAARLFEVLLAELDRRQADCFLTVSPDNSRALGLYRRYGFTEETFVSGYYRPKEDRLVLTRCITTVPSSR